MKRARKNRNAGVAGETAGAPASPASDVPQFIPPAEPMVGGPKRYKGCAYCGTANDFTSTICKLCKRTV